MSKNIKTKQIEDFFKIILQIEFQKGNKTHRKRRRQKKTKKIYLRKKEEMK